MPDQIQHTSYDEQQQFLKLSPDQQNLKIWLNGNETNGKVAEALRRIAKVEDTAVSQGSRIGNIERWRITVTAVLLAIAVAAGGALTVFAIIDRIAG